MEGLSVTLESDAPGAAVTRVVCAECGSEQEGPTTRQSRCVICSKPLHRGAVAQAYERASANAAALALVPARPAANGSRRREASVLAAANLPETAPDTGPLPEVTALLAAEKRLTSLLAFIPIWGVWRLSGSEQHESREKTGLGIASVLLTITLALGIAQLLPGPAQRAAAMLMRINGQINALGVLGLEYHREHGSLPDESAWKRSAESGDLRFYDPWGRIYRYETAQGGFAVVTYGQDGVPGGDHADADVRTEFPVPAAAS